jgi:hypothetical protein
MMVVSSLGSEPPESIADVQPPLGKQFLDIAVAQRETQVEPHSMLNDNRRKAVAAV